MSEAKWTGLDCHCGHPQMERDGQPWCSVYGRHRPPSPTPRPNIGWIKLKKETS